MTWDMQELICAIASAPGGAARGIVRLSGPQTPGVVASLFRLDAVPSICGAELSQKWSAAHPAMAREGDLFLTRLGRRLPTTLLLWPDRRSYTRQPMAELHTLGSPPLLEAVIEELLEKGARLAQPGEFTLRAFLNGRIDLPQAEAVLGVIDAGEPHELASALAQLAGGLSGRIQRLRDRLLDVLAHLEAGLDFADEGIALLDRGELTAQLQATAQELDQLEAQLRSRAVTRPIYRAVLVGTPNAGKSSLFNALVGRPAALVSAQAGTTRDYLTAALEIAGTVFELVDTAGTEPTGKTARASSEVPLDRAAFDSHRPALTQLLDRAVQLGQTQAQGADLILFCVDASRPPNGAERQPLHQPSPSTVVVLTKCDLPMHASWQQAAPREAVFTSARTRAGLDQLKARLAAAVHPPNGSTGPREGAVVQATASRCTHSLTGAAEAMARALEASRQPHADELVALELRLALGELGQVVGAVYTDDILNRIFSRFCIGK